MDEIHRNYSQEGVNHIILLTDGHTYGDAELCMEIASEAAEQGITINSVGIGTDWSDHLLKGIATKTGGKVIFLSALKVVTDLLHTIHEGVTILHVQVNGSLGEQINLRSAFWLQPEPVKLDNRLPMTLGHLRCEGTLRLLLELVVQPNMEQHELTLAHLDVSGDLPGRESEAVDVSVDIVLPIADGPDPNPPPDDIASALNVISFFRTQAKARREAGLGQVAQAARRLENLATHLLTSGDRDLAKAALNEAVQLSRSQRRATEEKPRLRDPDERQFLKLILMRRKLPDWIRPVVGLDLILSAEDIDHLTGFFEKIPNTSQNVSLALIEIDQIEEFIERYGRNAGEQILANLKSLLRQEFGEGAVLGKTLFDGYFIAYKSNSLGGAKILADQVRTSARKLTAVDSEGRSSSPISVTIGLAFYPDHGSTLEALFRASNFALFVGKSRGGDCVVPP
jgi:diguanylate cyclase (GGDEF)-like protein